MIVQQNKDSSKEKNIQALHYAEAGWKVHPIHHILASWQCSCEKSDCTSPGKHPVKKGWKDHATNNLAAVKTWWGESCRDANIGIATGVASGVFVLDVDEGEGKNGTEALARLESLAGPLPPTLTARTGSGGRHLFFKMPEGRDVGNKQGLLIVNEQGKRERLPNLDVRGTGGYVVAAPSNHASGGRYEWLGDFDVERVAEAPEAFLDIIAPRPVECPTVPIAPLPVVPQEQVQVIDRARAYLDKCDPAVQGQGGHNALLRAAGCMARGFLLDDATVLSLLWNEYNPRCLPPWNSGNPTEMKEFERKVSEARRMPMDKPDGWLVNKSLPEGHALDWNAVIGDWETETVGDEGCHPFTAIGPEETASDGQPTERNMPETGTAISEEKSNDEAPKGFQIIRVSDLRTPPADDPNELLRHRFLCRGGGGLIVGPSGVGKSSFIMQTALCWAIGRSVFGVSPRGALRILIIQAENDEGDMAEMRDGVLKGMIATGLIDEATVKHASECVETLHVATVTGDGVGELIRRLAKGFDLVILDPAFAYIGADVMQASEVSHFLRNVINPVLIELNIGLLIVHHTNKPLRTQQEKSGWQAGDFAYIGAGSAEWTNWARCVIALRSIGSATVFELRPAKRGGRLRWKDESGDPITVKYIAHSETGICWREAAKEDAASENQPPIKDKKLGWTSFTVQALELVLSKVWALSEFKKEIMDSFELSGCGAKALLQHVETSPDVLRDRAPNKGTSPVHLIGPKAEVEEAVERARGEAEGNKTKVGNR